VKYHEALYAEPEWLGNWSGLAAENKLPNLPAFDACIRDTAAVALIESDLATVKALEPRGTPTVIVNEWLLGSAPDSAKLVDVISRELRERRRR
jgi:hypothetical protein